MDEGSMKWAWDATILSVTWIALGPTLPCSFEQSGHQRIRAEIRVPLTPPHAPPQITTPRTRDISSPRCTVVGAQPGCIGVFRRDAGMTGKYTDTVAKGAIRATVNRKSPDRLYSY